MDDTKDTKDIKETGEAASVLSADEQMIQDGFNALLNDYLKSNHRRKVERITKAFNFANQAHAGVKRRSGEPYIMHPIAVARIVRREMGLGSTSICSALLHDVVEDTEYTVEDIRDMFGDKIAQIVDGLTKISGGIFGEQASAQAENFRKLLLTMSDDIRVILIKIADRLHNMRTLGSMLPAKQFKIAGETLYLYAPLAHRLGLFSIKTELEDLSFKYEHPQEYDFISAKLKATEESRNKLFERFAAPVDEKLKSMGLQYEMRARVKSVYSIWNKMESKGVAFEDIYDIYAVRIIFDPLPGVDEKNQCWDIYSAITDIYRIRPDRIRDWVSRPKANGYQALHLTVMGPDGQWVEIQIRSRRMDEIAEKGFAAHWKYKQNGQGGGDEGRYEWVRRLLENQEGADAEEFIHSLKVDMFADEVFVFTPRGDVINLPAGATPIDFAYNIHSAVGNHMVAAKVNGRIVPFDCRLKNGDIVEVVTSQSAHGPSRDWVKIARSSNARSKIRQWLKRERRDENVVTGRASFESELKRCGVSLKELTNDENLPGILKKLTYKSLDDLYAAIGYGGISSLKVIGRIREDIQRILHQHQEERQAEVPLEGRPDATRPAVPKRTHSEKGIIVEGLSNCLVKFSKCCTPVPGDDIVGFITKGYGVSVHRKDCPNADPARRRPDEEGRWIKVSWAEDVEGTFRTTLQVVAKDRINLIVDISTVLSSTKTHVASMNARSTPDGFALITLDTDVSSSQQLKTVMRRIEQISGVMRVTRPAG